MITVTDKSDAKLRKRLESLSRRDRNYWSFKGNSKREHGHGLLQYPAMMVPQVVRAVLKVACKVHPEISHVGDPFVGSGTVLTECMLKGLHFIGKDVNPLAVLLCRTKAGPFLPDRLKDRIAAVKAAIDADRRTAIEAAFRNRDKWFTREAQIALSKIRRAIRTERSLWARRFLWIGAAEAVRLGSNSRTSTVKLHVRTAEDIGTRNASLITIFKKAIDRNLKRVTSQAKLLQTRGYLLNGRYVRNVHVSLGDTRRARRAAACDIVVTSPPYGDNESTIPYGQYSYLPLQWIDLRDIDPAATAEYLTSTHEIDRRSLGGSKRLNEGTQRSLSSRSPSLARYLKRLADQPEDRARRVLAFFRDLDACLAPILNSLRPGGLLVWALGNRKVGGKRVPLDGVLSELLHAHSASLICRLRRRISSKRMARKNNVAETMSTETILVMRKAGGCGHR